VNVPRSSAPPGASDLRSLQGVLPGYQAVASGLGAAAHALGVAGHAIFHDPSLKYMQNQGVLKGVPHLGSWYDASAEMRLPLDQLDPVRAAILRAVLTASPGNADRRAPTDPIQQLIMLRALNPRNARLG